AGLIWRMTAASTLSRTASTPPVATALRPCRSAPGPFGGLPAERTRDAATSPGSGELWGSSRWPASLAWGVGVAGGAGVMVCRVPGSALPDLLSAGEPVGVAHPVVDVQPPTGSRWFDQRVRTRSVTSLLSVGNRLLGCAERRCGEGCLRVGGQSCGRCL